MTPSEQARADALADAETLVTKTRAFAARDARRLGMTTLYFAQLSIRCGDGGYGWAIQETRAAHYAIAAARAAFRAVPGLRG